MPERFIEQFHITKCSGKLDCLVKEMLYIRMGKQTCKRIPSVQRCLFRPFIVIYAFLLPFLYCMLFNKALDNGVMMTPKRRAINLSWIFLCFSKSLLIKYCTKVLNYFQFEQSAYLGR